MEPREIKVKFVIGHFVPLSRVNLKDGAVIEIEIISEKEEQLPWRGALKNIKNISVD